MQVRVGVISDKVRSLVDAEYLPISIPAQRKFLRLSSQ